METEDRPEEELDGELLEEEPEYDDSLLELGPLEEEPEYDDSLLELGPLEEEPEYDDALWEEHLQADRDFNAQLGLFIRAFEFLMGQTRKFIADCFQDKGLGERKLITCLLLGLTATPLTLTILPIYKCCRPEDKSGFAALKGLNLKMKNIIEKRNTIIHGVHFPIADKVGGSIVIKESMNKAKEIKTKEVLLSTTTLQEYVSYVSETGRIMCRVREAFTKGENIEKVLKTYNEKKPPKL